MESEQKSNPFQRIDEALEGYRQDAGTGKKLAKRAESVLRGARKAEADLLKPERISDRAFEAQTLPVWPRWNATSRSLADKIEKVSVRLGEPGLDETEKTALWSRFKNMVHYKEKIDSALKNRITDEVDRELSEDPLHVYARGLNEVEDEVLKHKEREASEIKSQADKLESKLVDFRKIEEHIEELEKPRDTAEEDRILDDKIEQASRFMEELDEVRRFMKRQKDWVDGSADGQGLDAKPISECAKRWVALQKEWDRFNDRKSDSLPKEESEMLKLRYKSEKAALEKRLTLDNKPERIDLNREVYKEAERLIKQGILHFDDVEMREIETIACLGWDAPSPKDLTAISSDGKSISLTEDEAKTLVYNWRHRIYDREADFPLVKAIRKYRNRDWYRAMKVVEEVT